MNESEMMRQVIDCCEAEDIVEYADLLYVLSFHEADDDLFEAVVAHPYLVGVYLASRKRLGEENADERED